MQNKSPEVRKVVALGWTEPVEPDISNHAFIQYGPGIGPLTSAATDIAEADFVVLGTHPALFDPPSFADKERFLYDIQTLFETRSTGAFFKSHPLTKTVFGSCDSVRAHVEAEVAQCFPMDPASWQRYCKSGPNSLPAMATKYFWLRLAASPQQRISRRTVVVMLPKQGTDLTLATDLAYQQLLGFSPQSHVYDPTTALDALPKSNPLLDAYRQFRKSGQTHVLEEYLASECSLDEPLLLPVPQCLRQPPVKSTTLEWPGFMSHAGKGLRFKTARPDELYDGDGSAAYRMYEEEGISARSVTRQTIKQPIMISDCLSSSLHLRTCALSIRIDASRDAAIRTTHLFLLPDTIGASSLTRDLTRLMFDGEQYRVDSLKWPMQEFTDDDELRAGSSLDGYRLQQRIGRGGYGEVWRVQDAFGSHCALKMIRATPGQKGSRARLRREYEGVRNLKAARMTDTAIVQIWHANQARDSSSFWYVMELADASPSTEAHYQAETLSEKLNRELRIELRDILRIVRPLADALVRLHARELIHRDIKPSNILFIQGQAKLGDCGLVSLSRDSITHVGTPNYMPRHCSPGTHADVYALATVCWEMMMGYPPTDAQEPEVADADTDLQHLMTIVAKYRSKEALAIENPAQQLLGDLIQLENELRRQGDQHGTC